MTKKLTYGYLCIQGLLALISVVFLWGILGALIQRVGVLIIVDASILLIVLIVGTITALKNVKQPSDRHMKMMTYLPILLLVEGGIVATLGVILMVLAMVMRYNYQPV